MVISISYNIKSSFLTFFYSYAMYTNISELML